MDLDTKIITNSLLCYNFKTFLKKKGVITIYVSIPEKESMHISIPLKNIEICSIKKEINSINLSFQNVFLKNTDIVSNKVSDYAFNFRYFFKILS